MRLEREVASWKAAGHLPVLWLRDDDAREPGPELARLLALTERHGIALCLAVIPDGGRAALAKRLARARHVSVAQHGIDHMRRTPPDSRPGEFAEDTSHEELVRRISAGRAVIATLPGAVALFTPPWNQIFPGLYPALATAGFEGVSGKAGEGAPEQAGIRRIDGHADLMRWSGNPCFRGTGEVLDTLREQLRRNRAVGRWHAPVGIISHHLAHDEAAWAFAEKLFTRLSGHVRWADVASLLRA